MVLWRPPTGGGGPERPCDNRPAAVVAARVDHVKVSRTSAAQPGNASPPNVRECATSELRAGLMRGDRVTSGCPKPRRRRNRPEESGPESQVSRRCTASRNRPPYRAIFSRDYMVCMSMHWRQYNAASDSVTVISRRKMFLSLLESRRTL